MSAKPVVLYRDTTFAEVLKDMMSQEIQFIAFHNVTGGKTLTNGFGIAIKYSFLSDKVHVIAFYGEQTENFQVFV